MKNFLFISHLVRGQYHYITADGDEVIHDGISLYLGTSKGNTVEEAWQTLVAKGHFTRSLPEVRIRHAYGYEITDDGVQVHMPKKIIDDGQESVPIRTTVIKGPNEKYESVTCQWCNESIPRNGAAQFSHLKKHINELLGKKLLDKEQIAQIRSIKLAPEIEVIFKDAYKKNEKTGDKHV